MKKSAVILSVVFSFASGLAAESFTFASWNIGHFMLGKHWEATNTVDEALAMVPRFQAFLAQAKPDVIGLCEYNDYLDAENSVAAAETVFGDFTGSVRTPVDGSIRNAIYWKNAGYYATDVVKFPKTSQNCFYRRAYVQIAGRKVCVVQCHLDWNTTAAGHELDRQLQIEQLIHDLKNEPYVVLGGDFNTCVWVTDHWEDAPTEFEPFVAAGYSVANRGTYLTWPSGDDAYQSIDNIIVRGFTISEVAAYGDPTLSDHKLIRAKLTFKDETAAVLASADYYADPSRPDDSGDGKSPATAKKTLQAAIDLAHDGDVVLALPGVYDQGGGAYGDFGKSRLVVTNAVTVRGLPGHRHDTIVKGAYDQTDTKLGPNAFRCAFLGKAGATLEGLTLCGGATRDRPDGGRWGGAVYSDLYTVYVSDCIIRENVAWRAGATHRATLTRCLVYDNSCASASSSGAIAQQTRFSNCVFSRNVCTDPAFLYCDSIVNCTFCNIGTGFVFGSANSQFTVCNSLLLGNAVLVEGGSSGLAGFRNCVTDAAAGTFRDDGDSFAAAASDQLLSSALDDWRLLSGATAVGRGEASHLSKVALPARLAQTDYRGDPIPLSGAINVGAVQAVATPASGKVVLNGKFTRVDGGPLFPGELRFGEWPTQIELIPSVEGELPLYGVEASGAATNFRVPDLEGRLLVMPPPASETEALTLTPRAAGAVLRVGAGDGKLATLQEAVTAATTDYTLVYVDAGRYATGGAKLNGQNSRLAISGKLLRFVGAGAGKSFIVGARDDGAVDGLGDNAWRCLSADNASIVQGFTLEGGYSGASDANLAYYGGAIYGKKNATQVLDCEITGCAAAWYTVFYADLIRCRMTRCTSTGGGQISEARLVNSLVCDTINKTSDGSGQSIVNTKTELHFSTVAGESNCKARRDKVASYNCIFFRGTSYYVTGESYPCMGDVFFLMGNSSGVSGAVMELMDPKFVSSDAFEFRLRSDSPAFGHFDDARCWTTSWKYATYDLDGRPLNIVDGKPTPGCFQWPVKPVAISAEGGGTVVPAIGYVTPDTPLAVRAVLNRPFLGFTLNGETLEASVTNLTLTIADFNAQGEVDLVAKFGTEWYVDAQKGKDSNSGAYLQDARQTLSGLLTDAKVVSGDTVRVAAGVYAGPVMTYSDNAYRAVAVVKSGVKLKSIDGPAVTTIRGSADETDSGLGANAVRCVVVENGGEVAGFTLTDGHSNAKGTAGNGPYGGAVLGLHYLNAVVRDCVIQRNVAYTGAAGYQCCFIRCRIVDNTAVNRGAVGQNISLYGCYMDNNLSDNMIDYAYRMENCTVGARASTGGVIKNPRDAMTVKNCLVLAGPHAWEVKANNSAFATGHGLDPEKMSNCMSYELAKYPLHPNGRPRYGNPVVDAGDESLCNWDKLDRDADLDGKARSVGAAIDIGALEAFPMPGEFTVF